MIFVEPSERIATVSSYLAELRRCRQWHWVARSLPTPLSRLDPDIEPDTLDAAVLDAMESFCRAWAPTYDLVFLTHDHYRQPSDSFRAKVANLQDTASAILGQLYQKLDVAVLDVPLGYETDQRVEWIAGRVAAAGVALAS